MTMKLYYGAGSCSMSCLIALEESGLPFEAKLVDFDEDDANLKELRKLNPLDVAPVMVTETGKTLTQNAAILEYIADKVPEKQLLPKPGTFERVDTIHWLSFVAADLHKSFGPLFGIEHAFPNKATQGEVKTWAHKNVNDLLGHVDQQLKANPFIAGSTFSVADCYLFIVVGWTKWVGISTDSYTNLNGYMGRMYQRPSVQKALRTAGLLK